MNFVARGSNDAAYVKAYAYAATAAILSTVQGAMYRQDIRIDSAGHELFYVTVPYAPRSESNGNGNTLQAGQWTWNVSTTGGSFHIGTSKETVGKFALPGKDAADHKQSINVQPDGTVSGTEIVIPALRLSVTYKHPIAALSLDHSFALSDLTGTVNSTTMFGRPAGELLFLGFEGSDGTDCEAVATYHFAREKNLQTKVIGGIEVAEKQGHDLLWIEYKTDVADSKKVSVPKHIYVERVYEREDLAAALGFGG